MDLRAQDRDAPSVEEKLEALAALSHTVELERSQLPEKSLATTNWDNWPNWNNWPDWNNWPNHG